MIIEFLAYYAIYFAIHSEIGTPVRWLVARVPTKQMNWFFTKLIHCCFCLSFWLCLLFHRGEATMKEHIYVALASATVAYCIDTALKALETYINNHDSEWKAHDSGDLE